MCVYSVIDHYGLYKELLINEHNCSGFPLIDAYFLQAYTYTWCIANNMCECWPC